MDRAALVRYVVTALGLMLGGSAWALVPGWALDQGATIRANISATGGVSVSSPVASWPATADGAGGARLLRTQALKVPSNQAGLQLSRLVTAANLSRAASIAARMAGPLVLVGLAYEGVRYLNGQWESAAPLPPDADIGTGLWRTVYGQPSTGGGYGSPEAACKASIVAQGGFKTDPGTVTRVGADSYNCYWANPPVAGQSLGRVVASGSCPAGTTNDGSGRCVGERTWSPATEEQLQTALQESLVANPNKAPEVLRSVVDYVRPEAQPLDVTGPETLVGPSTTITTVTDAGVETRLRATTYNISYQGDVVTVTETTTTTTTHPDASQTVETATTAEPQAGGEQAPPEEPTPDVCVEHPDASGCAPLGDHGEEPELQDESRDVSFEATLSANGTCPASKSLSIMGRSYSLSWGPICDLASGVRPVVIALAWLSAGVWLFGIARVTT